MALAEALLAPDEEAHAWNLHSRLMFLHGELHPADRAERGSMNRALRYLEHLDPTTASAVRDLGKEASRSLKAAFARLESTLDPFADEEVAAEAASAASEPGAVESPTPPEALTQTLSPTQEAAARRTVGRDLRTELQIEKKGFFDAAKAAGLKVGGKHEKAMFAALSEFLGVAVESRRTPSSRQWAQAASAIATEDLMW